MKIIVRVDSDLTDLVPGFLERKRGDAANLVAAAGRGDYEEIVRIGHRIRGEGGSFGFDAISEIGARIERSAKTRDLPSLSQCAEELRSYLDSVEVVFE